MKQLKDFFIGLFTLPEEKVVHMQTCFEGRPISKGEVEKLGSQVKQYLALVEGKGLFYWLEYYGIEIVYKDFAYDFPDLLYRAELNVEMKKIFVFQPLLEELKCALSRFLELSYMVKDVEEIIIAHEFFHYLYCTIGKKRKESIKYLETRAHLFTKHFLKLHFYPWILDLVHFAYRSPQVVEAVLSMEYKYSYRLLDYELSDNCKDHHRRL